MFTGPDGYHVYTKCTTSRDVMVIMCTLSVQPVVAQRTTKHGCDGYNVDKTEDDFLPARLNGMTAGSVSRLIGPTAGNAAKCVETRKDCGEI